MITGLTQRFEVPGFTLTRRDLVRSLVLLDTTAAKAYGSALFMVCWELGALGSPRQRQLASGQ